MKPQSLQRQSHSNKLQKKTFSPTFIINFIYVVLGHYSAIKTRFGNDSRVEVLYHQH